MKIAKHLKNRRLMAALVGVVVFGGIYGLAASLNLTTDQLGSGTATVSSCSGSNDVEVSYDTQWQNPSQSTTGAISSAGYYVYDVVMDGVPLSCAGSYYSITLTAGDPTDGTSVKGLETVTGQLPSASAPNVWSVTANTDGTYTYNCSDPTGNLNPPGPSATEPQYGLTYPPDGSAGPEPSCDWTVSLKNNILASDITNVEMVISTTQSDGQSTASLQLSPDSFSLSNCNSDLLIRGSGFGGSGIATYSLIDPLGTTLVDNQRVEMINGIFTTKYSLCNGPTSLATGTYKVTADFAGTWASANFVVN